MNKEQIYEAARLKGKVTRLSAFEKNIVDLTLEAVSESQISNTVNPKPKTKLYKHGLFYAMWLGCLFGFIICYILTILIF